MKASAVGFGGILVILLVTTLTVMFIIGAGEPVNRTIVTVEGKLMSFENNVNNFVKSYDQGSIFISQRAAYDLGKTGGMRSEAMWTSTFPTIDTLRSELEDQIKERLPTQDISDKLEVTFGDKSVGISDYDTLPCLTSSGSDCFFVNGQQGILVYDREVDSTVNMNPHQFSPKVESNYFKLLVAGRALMEEDRFNTYLSDAVGLGNEFSKAKLGGDERFADVELEVSISDDVITLTLVEHCADSDAYCFSPMNKGETGDPELNGVYDYNKLSFKYSMAQTGHSSPKFDFALSVNPNSDTALAACAITSTSTLLER
jgi:hypothetical protein